jgi:mRNA interferase RelE/StbE
VSYEVRIIRSAEKDMDKLPEAVHDRISKRITALEDNPRPRGVKKLSDRNEYRLRVGNYRILYTINDSESIVTIVAVGHRSQAYR